jgi:hypothetical protein
MLHEDGLPTEQGISAQNALEPVHPIPDPAFFETKELSASDRAFQRLQNSRKKQMEKKRKLSVRRDNTQSPTLEVDKPTGCTGE